MSRFLDRANVDLSHALDPDGHVPVEAQWRAVSLYQGRISEEVRGGMGYYMKWSRDVLDRAPLDWHGGVDMKFADWRERVLPLSEDTVYGYYYCDDRFPETPDEPGKRWNTFDMAAWLFVMHGYDVKQYESLEASPDGGGEPSEDDLMDYFNDRGPHSIFKAIRGTYAYRVFRAVYEIELREKGGLDIMVREAKLVSLYAVLNNEKERIRDWAYIHGVGPLADEGAEQRDGSGADRPGTCSHPSTPEGEARRTEPGRVMNAQPDGDGNEVPMELRTIFPSNKAHIYLHVKRHMESYNGPYPAAEFAEVITALTDSSLIAIDCTQKKFVEIMSQYMNVGRYESYNAKCSKLAKTKNTTWIERARHLREELTKGQR